MIHMEKMLKPRALAAVLVYPPLRVMVSDSSHIEHLLDSQMLDFALIQKPQQPQRFLCTPCPPLATVAVLHRSLLAGAPPASITLAGLCHYPLILQRLINGTGVYDSLLDLLRKSGGADVRMQVSQPEAILDWLAAGLEAATLLPVSETQAVDVAQCVVVPLSPDPQVYFPCIVRNTTATLPDDVAALLVQPFLNNPGANHDPSR